MMWNPMFWKISKIMDSLPEEVRLLVIQKYSVWEPKSARVKKVVKIISWLSPEEKQELMMFMQESLSPKEEEQNGDE